MVTLASKWPKEVVPLSDEQKRIAEDWTKYWLGILPDKHGAIVRFNHQYPVQNCRAGGRVLEIGAGLGEHISYENLAGTEYHAVELLPEIAAEIRRRHPSVNVVTANCEEALPFPDRFFDRAIAIHVLEHLRNLPAALAEVHRTLKPEGEFCVVIPCEGGLAYSLGRLVTAKRLFEKRYKMSYETFIRSEHVNVPREIMEELGRYFNVQKTTYYPLKVPSVNMNLLIGMVLVPRATAPVH